MSLTVSVEKASTDMLPSEAKSFFANLDDSVIEWRTHLQRKPAEFSSGEVVAAEVTVELDKTGQPYLRVANATCVADSFWPLGLDEDARKTLCSLRGCTVVALVTVTDRTGEESCSGSKYTVDPHLRIAQFPINPTASELLELPNRAFVLVEGLVTNLSVREELEHGLFGGIQGVKYRGVMLIDTPNGVIRVEQLTEKFFYGQGVLGNLRDKPVMVGEKVRLTAMIDDDRRLRSGYGHPFLLVPHPDRQAEYDELRREVVRQQEEMRAYIQAGDYQSARLAFAAMRMLELTHHENELVVEIARTMPSDEQPVFYHRQLETNALEAAYGTNVETLNAKQFVVFAREVLTNVRVNPPRDSEARVDQTYVYRYLEEDARFSGNLLAQLIIEMIGVRLPLLEQATDEMDSYWDHSYLIETSLGYLAEAATHEAYAELIRLVEYCLDHGYYRTECDVAGAKCPHRLDSLFRKVCDSLLRLFGKNYEYGMSAQPLVQEWIGRLEQGATCGDTWSRNGLYQLVPWQRYF